MCSLLCMTVIWQVRVTDSANAEIRRHCVAGAAEVLGRFLVVEDDGWRLSTGTGQAYGL